MKAALRAAERLEVTQAELAAILGLSASTLSRRARDDGELTHKEAELGALFVRVYRSLDALVGGDDAKARAWLEADNLHLGGRPKQLMRHLQGLVHVVEYLDAMRGKI